VVDVESYVASNGITTSWPRFMAAARLLARIHDSLDAGVVAKSDGAKPYVPPPVRLYGTPAELLGWMDETVEAIHTQQTTDRRAAPDAAEQALGLCNRGRTLLSVLDAWWNAEGVALPRGLTHGDYGTSNALFRGDRLAAVIDWDLLDERERTYDLARAFRWTLRRAEPALFAGPPIEASDAPADALDVLAGRLRGAVAAYDDAVARPLTQNECGALPLQMARVPLYDLAEVGRYVSPHVAGPVEATLRLSNAIAQAEWLVRHSEHLALLLR
jgi:hypothetical protein